MSREDDVGAAGVGEAAKDSRDELEDILKALEAGDSDKHGPNMKIIIGVIAGIVLVSVVLIIIMVNRKSVVPDFVGHTTAEAKQIAREAGVTLEEKKEYSSEVEEGCVISQDIAKGMKVKRKASVGITVSKGKEMTVVPEFVGETLEDARAMAAEAGIELEETEEYSKDVAAGLIIEQQDTQGQRDQVGNDRDGDALHRDARYPRRHEKVDSKRRRQHGDVVGHHKDYAEMDRVDAELEDHGQEHRYEDDDGRQRFHEHAEDIQHADDHEQHEMGIVGNAEHDGRKALRGFLKSKDLAEQGGRAHDEQHRAAGHRAVQQGPVDVPWPEYPVDHDAHEQRPHDGDHGRFHGRRPAGIDRAEDDERRRQREPGVAAAPEEKLHVEGRGVLVALEAVPLRQQVGGHDHREGHDEPGDEPCG